VTRDFHGDRDAHRGDRRHDVNVVRSNYLREFGAGSRHELDPHVDGDQQRQGQLFVERDEREVNALCADVDGVCAFTHDERAYLTDEFIHFTARSRPRSTNARDRV